MKTIYSILFFALFACFIGTGCQKQILDVSPVTTPLSPDSTLLSLYVEIDTTLAPPLDTLFKIVYSYDNLNRCTGNIGYEYNSGVPKPFNRTYFSYNANDTLKVRETFVDYEQIPKDSTIHYYTYNSNGELIRDSSSRLLNYPSTAATYYSYANNLIIRKDFYYFTGGTSSDTGYIHYQKTNGNITSQADTTFLGSSQDISTSTISYDNHPNPFYGVTINYPHLSFEHLQYEGGQQKNNIIDQVQYLSGSSSPNLHWTYQYKYKANGYPSEATFTSLSPGIADAFKVFLYYR